MINRYLLPKNGFVKIKDRMPDSVWFNELIDTYVTYGIEVKHKSVLNGYKDSDNDFLKLFEIESVKIIDQEIVDNIPESVDEILEDDIGLQTELIPEIEDEPIKEVIIKSETKKKTNKKKSKK